jgi:Ca2+-binding EF-hand superfamily protein
MTTHRLILLAGAFAAISALPATALAGKKKNQDPGSIAAAEVLAKYDTDHDGKISGDEATALRAAFAGADHDKLKRFDTNSDGALDDNEIAAIKAETGKKKKKNKN